MCADREKVAEGTDLTDEDCPGPARASLASGSRGIYDLRLVLGRFHEAEIRM